MKLLDSSLSRAVIFWAGMQGACMEPCHAQSRGAQRRGGTVIWDTRTGAKCSGKAVKRQQKSSEKAVEKQ